jgi:LPS export ABC transporter protein LptC
MNCSYRFKHITISNLFPIIVIAIVGIFLWGCETDMQQIKSFSKKQKEPVREAQTLKIIYFELGSKKVKIEAPKMEEFKTKAEHYINMPQGILVYFYDSLEQVSSSLSAERAVFNQKTHIFDARGNVVVKNIEKNQQLDTEHLIWNQQQGKILSDEFVKITTNEQIIMGDGLEADESFEYYQINKITGTITLQDAEMD